MKGSYPISSSVGTGSQSSITQKAIDVALQLSEAGNQYLVQNGVTINAHQDSLLTNQTVPQVNQLPVHGSMFMHTDQVVYWLTGLWWSTR